MNCKRIGAAVLMMMVYTIFCMSAAAAAPAAKTSASSSQDEARKVYSTSHVNPHPPVIDGRIDDPVWDKVGWEGGFVQFAPEERAAPSEKTEFKVLYDESYLYVAVRCWDSQAASIERRVARRDTLQGDLIEVTLDSLSDSLTGFAFSVNAAGVKGDGIYRDSLNSNGPDTSWDPIWDVKTSLDGEGWTAEMRIPFSQVRFGRKDEHVWGLQVMRSLFRKAEASLWQFIPRNASGWVTNFGRLDGLRGLNPPRQIELLPYAVASQRLFRAEPGNPFATGSRRSLFGGLDGKVGVTSDLTMTFTLNPDFGQVEADPSEVNLTAFETYFTEKRPFFIEGRNLFHFQLTGGDGDFSMDNLFYSRRVGRAPQYYPDAAAFVDRPETTSILAAFKLTGKTRSGLSIGVMESITAAETATLFSDGLESGQSVEPWTGYFGFRLQQDFRGGATTLGGMLTATNRDPRRAAHLAFLHDSAYTGGFDLTHRWRDRNYILAFNMAFSRVEGSPGALQRTQQSSIHYYQRPDATHIEYDPERTSLAGHGGGLSFSKTGGSMLNFSFGATWRSPGFELNDMGFLRQADKIMQFAWVGLRFTKPFSVFRNANVNFNQWRGWDFSGANIFDGGNVNAWASFKNFWNGGFGIGRQGEALSTSALRGGPALRVPGGWNFWGNMMTDSRKPVRFSLNGSGSMREHGEMSSRNISAGVTVQPSRAFQLTLSPGVGLYRSELQYIAACATSAGNRYVFGALDQKTARLTVRLNYSLTPDLSIQFYGMPFISAGKYDRFKHITDPRSRDWDNRYRLFGPGELAWDEDGGCYAAAEEASGLAYGFGRPDFNFVQFRSNLVIRWEYIPGSTLYLVWSQGRTGFDDAGDFSFGRDAGNLFDIHPDNVFLIKFSYCFQL